MRILLINPGCTRGFEQFSLDFPPLGLASLAAWLKANNHQVVIWDKNVQKPGWNIRPEEFDLVGVTADTPRFPAAMEIASLARSSGVPVVMGGPHVSYWVEEPLVSEAADFIIRNEGDMSLLSLVEHLSQGGNDPAEVPGLSFMQDGGVVHNPDSQAVRDLDKMPYPARELLQMQDYGLYLGGRRATSMISSRGCPFNCSFCASSQLFGLKWRPRSPESMVDEVEWIQKEFGIRAIYFMDDNFTLDPDRAIAFCELVLKKELDVSWFCFSRADTIVKRQDMVEAMAKAGARMVFLGIESVNPQTLQHFNKNINTDLSARAVDLLKRYQLLPMCSFIIGDLHDNRTTIQQTIKFSSQLAPKIAQFGILTPYPGTRLFSEVKDRILNVDWSFFDGLHATIRLDTLPPQELEMCLKKAYFSFYFNVQRSLSSHLQSFWYLTRLRRMFS